MAHEKILVVDDEQAINKLICSYIKNEQFTPISAYNGKEAIDVIRRENPDLVILDVMLPDTDGPALCLEMRKISNVPIIFLSCKTQEIDKIIALSSGGDDYITKPFMAGELIARIKAHLRRQNTIVADMPQTGIYNFGELKIDLDAHEVFLDNKPVNIIAKEFEILKLLIENPRKVFSAKQIYELIWKTKCMENDARTVMVYISTLRKKLADENGEQDYIISVRGIGYKFNQSLNDDHSG